RAVERSAPRRGLCWQPLRFLRQNFEFLRSAWKGSALSRMTGSKARTGPNKDGFGSFGPYR
ncbi:hypothetical protein M9458_039438, partial [Cirrhinus mrigala]